MVLFVRRRNHCGMERFCFCFFAKMRFTLKVFCDGCKKGDPDPRQPPTVPREAPVRPRPPAPTSGGASASPTPTQHRRPPRQSPKID